MHNAAETTPAHGTTSVIRKTVSFLNSKGLNIEAIALTGSRARGQENDASDYDLLVVTNSSRDIHIEDVMVQGHKVQLFLLPLRCIDVFLILNTTAGNGIMASMFDPIMVFHGKAVFDRISTNLRSNLNSMDQIQRNSVNRNINRLRNRMSKLIKDLKHSDNPNEDLYSGAELFKTAGQFLLAKRSKFFLPSEKHLCKELIKFYPAKTINDLSEAYSTSVAETDYSKLIKYCSAILLDGHVLRAHSSSNSAFELKIDLGQNVVFINSFDHKIISLMFGIVKDHRPQVVLNQDRDLLHPGVYFIVDIPNYQVFLESFKALPLARVEFDSITLNYQLDIFLLEHFKRYDREGLLVNLSMYAMDADMDRGRNINMNSVLDWILNVGISIFSKEQYLEYVRICIEIYLPSMPHEPEGFDLNRITDRDNSLKIELGKLDLSSLIERYRSAISKWACLNVADVEIKLQIIETYKATLYKVEQNSSFKNNTTSFSNYFYLFESVFDSMFFRYRDRGLIYYTLLKVLEAGD